MASRQPRYPIYIPSKGRAKQLLTNRMFDKYGTPYRVVVEPQDYDNYAAVVGENRLVVLPKNNGGLVYARNFIKQHSIEAGAKRHWQFDDDIRRVGRFHKGSRITGHSGVLLAFVEDFIERYENVGLASLNEKGFLPDQLQCPPFHLNYRCYTCFIMLNELPLNWRFRYNEDTDMTLQVLGHGWCTILFNAVFMQCEPTNYGGTVTRKQGGQASVYYGDGRLKMARDLERQWPHIVTTTRRFGRPQHKVNWRKFKHLKLIRRKDIDWNNLPPFPSIKLTQVAEKINSPRIQQLYSELGCDQN